MVVRLGIAVFFTGLALVWVVITRWPARDTPAPTGRTSRDSVGHTPREAVLPVESHAPWEQVDDPVRDGWAIEARAEQAKQALDQLGQLLLSDRRPSSESLRQFCDADYQGGPLRPKDLVTAFQDGVLHVERGSPSSETDSEFEATVHGAAGFEAAVRDWTTGWSTRTDKRLEFKVIQASEQNQQLETRQLVAASGRADGQLVEQHATWMAQWVIAPGSDALKLRSLRLLDFEQTTSRTGKPLFSDCTESVLGSNDCYRSQFLRGMNHWLERNQDMRYFSPLGNPGQAVGDVNGDGLDDLFVCQEANLPNRLFLRQPDGSARGVRNLARRLARRIPQRAAGRLG